jgi:hypothetical protein
MLARLWLKDFYRERREINAKAAKNTLKVFFSVFRVDFAPFALKKIFVF